MEIEKFFDRISSSLFEKILKETDGIKRKLDRLESKLEEQKNQFQQSVGNLRQEFAPLLEDFAKENAPKAGKTQKNETENVDINPSSLKPHQILSLDYIKSQLKYNPVAEFGPGHELLFVTEVKVNGKQYHGVGSSKKCANHNAAESVLKSLIDQQKNSETVSNYDSLLELKDFLVTENVNINIDVLKANQQPLAYLKSVLKYNLVEKIIGPHKPTFRMAVKVNDKFYFGVGNTQANAKDKKNSINKIILRTFECTSLFKKLVQDAPICKTAVKVNNQSNECTFLKPAFSYTSTFKSDIRIANGEFTGIGPTLTRVHNIPKLEIGKSQADFFRKIVESKIEELLVNDLEHYSKRKVTAGIVMTRNGNCFDCCVIAIAAGTRCIPGKNLSYTGANLNDMHAEVLARRCLIKYFYDQLELKETDSIFVRNGRKFALKAGIDDNQNSKKNYGLLRTKIEAGEGTHPTKNKTFTVQTVEKIAQGERLLTMSCSDKICRWNVLGLQGALLANFLEPIYLKSVILGNVIHESHLQRALYVRIKDTLPALPPPYHLNTPLMFFLPSIDTNNANGPSFAITWTRGDASHQIINTKTGQTDLFEPSKLSKQEFFKRFVYLSKKFWGQSIHSLYVHGKYADLEHNIAKKNLYEAFENAELGNWISKPAKVDMFTAFV